MEPPGKVVHLESLRRREEELEQRWASGRVGRRGGHGRHFICKYLAPANHYLGQGETLKN